MMMQLLLLFYTRPKKIRSIYKKPSFLNAGVWGTRLQRAETGTELQQDALLYICQVRTIQTHNI